LSYIHARQLFVGTFVSSFRHEGTSTGGKIYTKMQMQDLFYDFYFNHLRTILTIGGCICWAHSPR
jgi:hypothetical protein